MEAEDKPSVETGTGRRLAKGTEFQGGRTVSATGVVVSCKMQTANSRRSRGLREEEDVSRGQI